MNSSSNKRPRASNNAQFGVLENIEDNDHRLFMVDAVLTDINLVHFVGYSIVGAECPSD